MPFTRARHDGSNQPTSPHNTKNFRLKFPHFGLALPLASLVMPGLVASAAAKSPVGVPAWTSGSQTYIRIRPDVKTPPVAKVAKHTQLFVWGKKDGWYRVETPDHIFGWVYYDYINSPAIGKVKELSDRKARVASARTDHQVMYGSPQLLKSYYARYGAKGAVKGLANHGVYVAAKPKPKPPVQVAVKPKPKPAVRVAAKPVVRPNVTLAAATPKPKTVVAAALPVAQRPAPRTALAARIGSVVPSPENANVGPRTEAEVELPRATTPARATVPAPKLQAEAIAKAPDSIASAARGLARAATVEASRPDEVSVTAVAPEATAPVQVAPAARPVPVAKPVVAAPKPKPAIAKAPVPARPKAKPKARLTWRDQKRQQLRKRLELASRSKTRPTAPAQIAPISPEELMRARDEYLANRGGKTAAPATVPADPAPAATALAPAPPATLQPSSAPAQGTPLGGPVVTVASSQLKPTDGVKDNFCGPKTTAQPAPQPAVTRGAMAFRGGSPRDRVVQRGGSPRDRFTKSFGQGVADQALSYRGMPYIRGASSPSRGFDCSGLVYYVLRRHGLNPPRTAAGYRNYGKAVAKGDLQPGDVLLFANTYKRGISHVGVYMGNGKFVHAATSGTGVRVSSLNEAYYTRKYYGARRVK